MSACAGSLVLNLQDEGAFTPLAAALGGSQDSDAQAQAQEVIFCLKSVCTLCSCLHFLFRFCLFITLAAC